MLYSYIVLNTLQFPTTVLDITKLYNINAYAIGYYWVTICYLCLISGLKRCIDWLKVFSCNAKSSDVNTHTHIYVCNINIHISLLVFVYDCWYAVIAFGIICLSSIALTNSWYYFELDNSNMIVCVHITVLHLHIAAR